MLSCCEYCGENLAGIGIWNVIKHYDECSKYPKPPEVLEWGMDELIGVIKRIMKENVDEQIKRAKGSGLE